MKLTQDLARKDNRNAQLLTFYGVVGFSIILIMLFVFILQSMLQSDRRHYTKIEQFVTQQLSLVVFEKQDTDFNFSNRLLKKQRIRRKRSKIANGKKGIGLALRPIGQPGSYMDNLPTVLALNAHWNYGWQLQRVEGQPDVPVFIPMAWGAGRSYNDFESIIDRSNVLEMIQQGKVKHVFGFNEPDSETQSNIAVSDAIDRWPVLMNLGVPLVSPSCQYADSTWMQDFMNKAGEKSLRVDYVGIHWYSGIDFNNFQERITSYYTLYKKPIVLTEFAVWDEYATTVSNNRYSPDDVLAFMKEAIRWLEQTSWVAGYAWFSFPINNVKGWSSALFDLNGDLTPLGQYYKNPF